MRWVRMTAATLQQIPAAKMSHPHHSRQPPPLPGEVSTKSVPGAKRHCQSGKKKHSISASHNIMDLRPKPQYGFSHQCPMALGVAGVFQKFSGSRAQCSFFCLI